eukprot:6184163-Pleurochrysis_carterae.AAC.2
MARRKKDIGDGSEQWVHEGSDTDSDSQNLGIRRDVEAGIVCISSDETAAHANKVGVRLRVEGQASHVQRKNGEDIGIENDTERDE